MVVIHIHNLRAFNYDAERSTIQFLILWSGFGEESDTWELYKTLMHREPLHRYLRDHKMKSFISSEHK